MYLSIRNCHRFLRDQKTVGLYSWIRTAEVTRSTVSEFMVTGFLFPVISSGDAFGSGIIHWGSAMKIMTVHQNKSKTGHSERTSLKSWKKESTERWSQSQIKGWSWSEPPATTVISFPLPLTVSDAHAEAEPSGAFPCCLLLGQGWAHELYSVGRGQPLRAPARTWTRKHAAPIAIGSPLMTRLKVT